MDSNCGISLVYFLLLQFRGAQGGNSCSCRCSSGVEGGPMGSLGSNSRIFGGSESSAGTRPFQVGFIANGKACGGSIYNSRTILTAAHCITGKGDAAGVQPYVGSMVHPVKFFRDKVPGLPVAKITPHPNWGSTNDPSIAGYDVGLITLATPLQYTDNVQPIGVVEPGIDLVGKDTVVSGWGRTSLHNETMKFGLNLKEASGRILRRDRCITILQAARPRLGIPKGPNGELLYKSLCSQGSEGGEGGEACVGDSGGPLTCQVGDKTKLCGVVSLGFDCGRGHPGVYTELNDPEIYEWILENAGEPDTPTHNF